MRLHKKIEDVCEQPVKKIMNKKFIHVDRKMKLEELIALMKKNPSSEYLVVDKRGKFLGDIDQRDFLQLAIDPDRMSERDIIGALGTRITEGVFSDKVEDIMTTHELTVGPGEPVEDLVVRMWNDNVRAVPVVSEGKIIGVVSENQIVKKVISKIHSLKVKK